MGTLRIGVVGFSAQAFDKDAATLKLEHAIISAIADHSSNTDVEIVSGLTNLGIPAIAYAIAGANGYKTVGIACQKARKYECFPVDEEIIVGSEWGDESETFLDYIDVMVRVGGGKQTLTEVATFRESGGRIYEHELEAIPATA